MQVGYLFELITVQIELSEPLPASRSATRMHFFLENLTVQIYQSPQIVAHFLSYSSMSVHLSLRDR